ALPYFAGQIPAVNELHDQEMAAVGLARIVSHNDVRMSEPRYGLYLTLKPFDQVRRVRDICGQNLDRHHTAHVAMPGFVDCSHAAGADAIQYIVAPDREFRKSSFAHRLSLKGRKHPGGD